MADGGMTNERYQSLKRQINDPFVSLAVRKELQFFLDIVTLPQRLQDDQDRRYRNFCAYCKTLSEDRKPTTMGGHRDMLARSGIQVAELSRAEAAKEGHIGDFMQMCGSSMSLMDSYEMQDMEDAKPWCDHCKKDGATIRCRQCGVWYCSQECQRANWSKHKRACKLVAEQRTYATRLNL